MVAWLRTARKNFAISLVLVAICLNGAAVAATAPAVTVQKSISAGLYSPVRVAMDAVGDIYVTDPTVGGVVHYNKYGRNIGKLDYYDANGVAVDQNGRLIVTSYTQASIFTADGTEVRKLGNGAGQFQWATDVAVAANGNIYVTDARAANVQVFSANGDFAFSFGTRGAGAGQFVTPTAIAVNLADNQVAVADKANGRIQFFNLNGTYVKTIGRYGNGPLLFSAPQGLAFDYLVGANGALVTNRLYVVDCFQSTVQVVDPAGAGTFLAYIGQYGTALGALNTPTDALFDAQNGRLIVVNGLGRLEVYGVDGGSSPSNAPPSLPLPGSPVAGSEVNELAPQVVYSTAIDPENQPVTYEVRLLGAKGDVLVAYAAGSATTFILPAQGLVDGTLYGWQVRSSDGLESSVWSEVAKFYYNPVNDVPSTPQVVTPANGAHLDSTGALAWNAAADPDMNDTLTYRLEIAKDAAFANILGADVTPATAISLAASSAYPQLVNKQTYYWRVAAVDNHGLASTTDGVHSFVLDIPAVTITANLPQVKVSLGASYNYPGRVLGETPLTLTGIAPGTYTVAFEKAGFEKSYAQLVVPQSGDVALRGVLHGATQVRHELAQPLRGVDGQPLLVAGEAAPVLVDFNANGGKDLLVADVTGAVSLYRQVAGAFSKEADLQISLGSAPVFIVADFDNDGRKDLVVGNADGSVAVYLNSGTETQPVYAVRTTLALPAPVDGGVLSFVAPVVADMDGDGKKDLLLGTAEGLLYFFRNTGSDATPVFTDAPLRLAQVVGRAVPYIADWSGDGQQNVLVGTTQGQVVRYTVQSLNGTVQLYAAGLISLPTVQSLGQALKPFLAEVDGRNGKDLLLGNAQGNLFMLANKPAPFVAKYYVGLLEKNTELQQLATQGNAPAATLATLQQVATAIQAQKLGQAATLLQGITYAGVEQQIAASFQAGVQELIVLLAR